MTDSLDNTLLAILRLAHEHNDGGLIRTALVKYVYLLDVLCARQSGETWTKAEWRFIHFGPYAASIGDGIDSAAKRGLIGLVTGEELDADRDFSLYSFPSHSQAPTLRQLGTPGSVALELTSLVRRFKNDLSTLLDYVYFRTEPMEHAIPKSTLDFSNCQPLDIKAFRPVDRPALSKKKKADGIALVKSMAAKRRDASASVFTGEFDETYYQGLKSLQGDELPTGLSGHATLPTR